jgi:hypothetical protein
MTKYMDKSEIERLAKIHEDHLQSMVNQRDWVLRVTVATKEDAQELLEWLYAKDKPMQATLHSIEYPAKD